VHAYVTPEVSGAKNKFLFPKGSEIYFPPWATPKNAEIFLAMPPVPPFKF